MTVVEEAEEVEEAAGAGEAGEAGEAEEAEDAEEAEEGEETEKVGEVEEVEEEAEELEAAEEVVVLEGTEVGRGAVEAVYQEEVQELWHLEAVVGQFLGDHKFWELINQDQYLLAAQVLDQ
jgi:hypothetical protein